MSKELTIDDAVLILQDFLHPRFAEAKRYLESVAPNHPALKELAEREEDYRRKHAMVCDDASVYMDNAKDLQEFSNDYYASNFGVRRKYMDEVASRIEIYATDEKTGKEVALSQKQTTDYLNLLFQKSKLETSMTLLGSENYHKLSHEEKKEVFREATNDRFFANMAQVTMASAVVKPEGKELELGSQEQLTYIQKLSNTFRSALKDIEKTDGKLKVSEDVVLVSVMDTADQAQAYQTQLKEKARTMDGESRKKLNEVAVRVAVRKQNLEGKADKVSGGKYKRLFQTFRENKYQIATNAAATIALTLSGYGTIALVAYGAYMAASSWIMPILNETQKAKIESEEKGMQPLSFKQRWHDARVKLMGDKETGQKGDEKYKRKAIITSAVSVLSFGLLAKHAAAFQSLDDCKRVFSLTRLGVANMTQATEAGYTGVNVLKNKKDENAKKEFKSALKGLGIGLAAGALTQGIQAFVRNFDSIKETVSGWFDKGSLSDGTSIEAVQTVEAVKLEGNPKWATDYPYNRGGSDSLTADSSDAFNGKGPLRAGGVDTEDIVPQDIQSEPFPSEWNKNLGIEKWRYDLMKSNINNGLIANFDPQSLDRAYMNMDNQFVSQFVDQTRLDEMLEDKIIDAKTYAIVSEYATGVDAETGQTQVFPSRWNEDMGIDQEEYDKIMSNVRFRSFYDLTELARNGTRHQDILIDENGGLFIETPTGNYRIIDEATAEGLSEDECKRAIIDDGIVQYAKDKYASCMVPEISRLHGREFLSEQFASVQIEGMTDEKMQQAIDIAMRTYDPNQVAGATAEMKELFPDMSEKQTQTVRRIINYNRQFDENGEQMTKLLEAVNCGDKEGMNYETARNLLNQREEILSRSKGDAVLDSQESDCGGRMLHSRPMNKPVEEPVEEYRPDLPEAEKIKVQETPVRTRAMPDMAPEEQPVAEEVTPVGRQYEAKQLSDHYSDAGKQKTIPSDKAERFVRKQKLLEEHPILGVFMSAKDGNSNN